MYHGGKVRYYIDGFTGIAQLNEKVIYAARTLRDEIVSMEVSRTDNPFFQEDAVDDGFCVVDSLYEAFSRNDSFQAQFQISQLKVLFPGHKIYYFSSLHEREEVVFLIRQKPDFDRVA